MCIRDRVYAMADMEQMRDAIDVMILCGGSATDLPKQTPEVVKMFNTCLLYTSRCV